MYLEETIDSLDVDEDSGLSNDEPETSRQAAAIADHLSKAVDQGGAGITVNRANHVVNYANAFVFDAAKMNHYLNALLLQTLKGTRAGLSVMACPQLFSWPTVLQTSHRRLHRQTSTNRKPPRCPTTQTLLRWTQKQGNWKHLRYTVKYKKRTPPPTHCRRKHRRRLQRPTETVTCVPPRILSWSQIRPRRSC